MTNFTGGCRSATEARQIVITKHKNNIMHLNQMTMKEELLIIYSLLCISLINTLENPGIPLLLH